MPDYSEDDNSALIICYILLSQVITRTIRILQNEISQYFHTEKKSSTYAVPVYIRQIKEHIHERNKYSKVNFNNVILGII